MADYAARRSGNNLSPIDSQSRNRNTFQLNKRKNNTRNTDGLSASITEAGKMLSKSQINSKNNNFFSDIGSSQSLVSNLKNMKNEFAPMPDRRTSPDSKGFKIVPRSQTPKERVRDKS